MKMSCSKMRDLIRVCGATLKGMNLENVELKSGTWSVIFQELCGLPNLTVFHLTDGCGYAVDGISRQWRPRGRQRYNYDKENRILDAKEILTTFWLDKPTLADLQRRVVVNRLEKGLQPIRDEVYRYLSWRTGN